MGYSQNPAGIPLLRLKVHLGDSEPYVLSECFTSLLQLSVEQAPLVIDSLATGSEPVQELAALALDIYRHTTEIWQQVTKVAQLRDDASLTTVLT